jgi:hypothetical protein
MKSQRINRNFDYNQIAPFNRARCRLYAASLVPATLLARADEVIE